MTLGTSQTNEEIDFAFLSKAPIGISIPRIWLQILGYALLHSQSKCLLVCLLDLLSQTVPRQIKANN